MKGYPCYSRTKPTKETYTKVHASCDNCGASFFETRAIYNKRKRHFCCVGCYHSFRKTKLPFEEQHAYKGVRKEGESKSVYHKRYIKKNPEKMSFLSAQRRAREAGAEGSFSIEDWNEMKKSFNYKCACCGEEKPLTKDHIIPLSKGGSNYITNIQPLCRSCNSRKHNKLPVQNDKG